MAIASCATTATGRWDGTDTVRTPVSAQATSLDRYGRTPECHGWACPGLCFLGNLEVRSTGLAVPGRLSVIKTAAPFARCAASAAHRCAIRFPSALKDGVPSEVFYVRSTHVPIRYTSAMGGNRPECRAHDRG